MRLGSRDLRYAGCRLCWPSNLLVLLLSFIVVGPGLCGACINLHILSQSILHIQLKEKTMTHLIDRFKNLFSELADAAPDVACDAIETAPHTHCAFR